MFGLTVVTAPTEEPLTRLEAKRQCGIADDLDYHDPLIDSLIIAARRYCETWTGKAFITQTLRLTLDQFPCGYGASYDGPAFYEWGVGGIGGGEIRLPRPPLSSVTSIQYANQSGGTTTLSTSVYSYTTTSEVGRVFLKFGQVWPTDVLWQAASVTINYVAGYGAASAVPADIKAAMKLLISHWFNNREAVGNVGGTVAMAAESLLGSAWSGQLTADFG